LRIGVTVRQSAAPQTFALGTTGATMAVEAYEVSAVGTTLVDLRNFAPFGEIHGLSQIRATIQHAGTSELLSVNSDLMVDLAPLPAATQVAAPAPAAPAPANPPVGMR
jgi:hypothetical protein